MSSLLSGVLAPPGPRLPTETAVHFAADDFDPGTITKHKLDLFIQVFGPWEKAIHKVGT